MAEERPAVFTIPAHRSFADALVDGLLRQHGRAPDALARGRILVPTNRAVRTLTEAFVRISGGGLVLPRLIAIGDPELDDRIGGALDPLDLAEPLPPAIDPLERQLILARILRGPDDSAAEAMRLAADLARALDALAIEEVDPQRLREAALLAPELAAHWSRALDRFLAVIDRWPRELAALGRIDRATRRGHLLHAIAKRWQSRPPSGFTVAAGITTSAPAVAALLARVARLPDGAVVLPALALANAMPDPEWDALGPDAEERGVETHPQYHLKRLLDRIGVARGEVLPWPGTGRAASPAVRGRAVTHAMTAADFSDKWNALSPPERRLSGIRCAELADGASEAQAIALALREALETPGQTAALVTPDRILAARVSAHLARWNIVADDSAGQPLSQTPAGTLLLALAEAIAEDLAPVATLALLKHPLVGGEDQPDEGAARLAWLAAVRDLDLALRGPRPRAGVAGLDERIVTVDKRSIDPARAQRAWASVRPRLADAAQFLARATTLAELAAALRAGAVALAGQAAWRGPDGRAAADLIAALEQSAAAQSLVLGEADSTALLGEMFAAVPVRRPYGGHPRIAIWGLLEARLQQADLMILGGMNEGIWPAAPSPDPWLAPRIRRALGLPGLELRAGLAAHDFMSALGAPRVLLTRARRDGRSPTVASRLWLRLQAMTGGLARDTRLERLALALDRPDRFAPVDRPAPVPPLEQRPRKIAVTDLDRLTADPFAFYAKTILRLRALDPVDADHTAAWKGTAVHEVLEQWFRQDDCDPATLVPRARELVEDEGIHPMLRALWQPRLIEAVQWIAGEVEADRAQGRAPKAAELFGKAQVAGVELYGKVDRIDIAADGSLAIIDYKTGKAPSAKAVAQGFALQLGLLALIAERGGFEGISGTASAFEYWSLAKDKQSFGKRTAADKGSEPGTFLVTVLNRFADAAAKYLTGTEPFTAKLHPAHAPYGDYDQVMRLEEWYGRE
ncbi:MAG: double-strand break repair protein AddB [Pseudomonadota bacterium]|nr:double-strand break repair protein AddB [Pseudomonadota bacterium]